MKKIIIEENVVNVQISKTYKEITVLTENVDEKGLFLKLTRSYNTKGMTPDELYNATRKEWKVNINRATQAEYVFALHNNDIVEVYKPLNWYVNIKTGRLMFEGQLAPNVIRQKYLGMHISKFENYQIPTIYNF